MADKKADLAGPGIGDYEEVERILPKNIVLYSIGKIHREHFLL